jgi:hypothetical protein
MSARWLFEVPLLRRGSVWPLGDVVLPVAWRAVMVVALVLAAILAVAAML